MKLSIIVPCFNEEESLPFFFAEAEKIRAKMAIEFEYVFVNDGSKDQTLQLLKELHTTNPESVHYLDFSRNFGKEAAIYAGLQHATGDYVTLMDADLQDPPEMLPEMLRLIREEGYDCVGTCRTTRKGEPIIRSLFAELFYRMIRHISEVELVDGARDFRLMTRQVVMAILQVNEYNRFSKGIFSWVGFKTMYLPYDNKERVAGKTSWSFWKLFSYSLEAIINFSDAPLTIATFIGLFSFIGAGFAMLWIIIKTLVFGDPTSGWPSMVCIFLLVGGLQLFCLGIVGKYIGKIFLETKKRPLYILKEQDQMGKKES